jgi:hypothetical protein
MFSREQSRAAGRSPSQSPAARTRVVGDAGRAWLAAFAVTTSVAVALGLAAAPGVAAAKGSKAAGACPTQAKAALPLSANATKKASQAALAAAPERYKGLDVNGATVVWSKVASAAGARGGEVAFQCGKTTQVRTIVVELRFPKELPSSSLSQGVVFVSRFKHGYQVWEVAH